MTASHFCKTKSQNKEQNHARKPLEITVEGYQNEILKIRAENGTMCPNMDGDIMLSENQYQRAANPSNKLKFDKKDRWKNSKTYDRQGNLCDRMMKLIHVSNLGDLTALLPTLNAQHDS